MSTETATANETDTVTIYTTAPAACDGFSTVTIDEVAGTDKYNGKVYRRVEMQRRDLDWQSQRYGSGMCVVLSQSQFDEWVKSGLIVQHEPDAFDWIKENAPDFVLEYCDNLADKAVADAAVALIASVGQVNRGMWQVPHTAMQGLMLALKNAGIDF